MFSRLYVWVTSSYIIRGWNVPCLCLIYTMSLVWILGLLSEVTTPASHRRDPHTSVRIDCRGLPLLKFTVLCIEFETMAMEVICNDLHQNSMRLKAKRDLNANWTEWTVTCIFYWHGFLFVYHWCYFTPPSSQWKIRIMFWMPICLSKNAPSVV